MLVIRRLGVNLVNFFNHRHIGLVDDVVELHQIKWVVHCSSSFNLFVTNRIELFGIVFAGLVKEGRWNHLAVSWQIDVNLIILWLKLLLELQVISFNHLLSLPLKCLISPAGFLATQCIPDV